MSTTRTSSTAQREYSAGAVGLIVFAATVMIIGGVMQALQGLVALFNDTFYVVGEEYLFQFDVTAWGWIHLLLGIVVAVAGFSLLQGATWARVVAIVVASVSILVNFVWMPFYPLWSMIIIALGIAVIWALSMHGRDVLGE
ncbi:hypothetical protein [Nostocoides sp. F2B08]|uniref:DUF7144 family membrane protein n=1 Tax=Nostocoides sp. F2B08 TaxID=2653936 RepID=UPI00186B1508|nr:hypothetical protein [Tetrasphaera sp. F2B08]